MESEPGHKNFCRAVDYRRTLYRADGTNPLTFSIATKCYPRCPSRQSREWSRYAKMQTTNYHATGAFTHLNSVKLLLTTWLCSLCCQMENEQAHKAICRAADSRMTLYQAGRATQLILQRCHEVLSEISIARVEKMVKSNETEDQTLLIFLQIDFEKVAEVAGYGNRGVACIMFTRMMAKSESGG